MKTIISEEIEQLGRAIVSSAFKIHSDLGPGLLEKVYEICMAHELNKMGIPVERQTVIPINYDGLKFDEALKLDLLVAHEVVVEIKSVEVINPVWQAQVISQLRLSNKRLGYLINFNTPLIKDGIRRFINTKFSEAA